MDGGKAGTARKRLEAARAASMDLQRMEHVARALKGRTVPPGVPGYEEAAAGARAACAATIRAAALEVWGAGGDGGAAAVAGPRAAAVLQMRYLDALPWKQVAACMGLSVSMVRLIAARAVALMDEVA